MKIDEIISKADKFATNFIAKLGDKAEQPARKQTYFLDNQDDLQKYMGALQKIITSIEDADYVTTEEDELLDKANEIVNNLKQAIAEYQKELVIDSNVSEEDTTATLTEETISDAMKNNKTTQEITANMQAIAEQQKASQIGFNYALVCDGQLTMLAAENEEQLNGSINAIADTGNYQDIKLYQLTFTPVPLKKKTIQKTILSV
jgi:sugar-specific transcriptional regulator TrmB